MAAASSETVDVESLAPPRGANGLRSAPPGAIQHNPDWAPVRRRLFGKWIPVEDRVRTDDPTLTRLIDRMWVGDPAMDAVVAMFGRIGAGGGRRLFQQALAHGIDSLSDPPPELVALFAELDRRPAWIDMRRVERGAIVAANIGPAGKAAGMFLNTIATVQGGAVGSAVGATGRMQRDALHRARESAAFWVNLPRPGGLERYGVAFQNAVRVRLMHAQARAMLMRRWGASWVAENGVPIPNASLVAGIPTFGIANLMYDANFGAVYDREDLEDIHAFWTYIGYVLGAAEDILPRTPEEGMKILDFALSIMPPPSQYADALNAISNLLLDSMMESTKFPVFDAQIKPYVRQALHGFYFYVGGDFLGSRITETPAPTLVGKAVPLAMHLLTRLSNLERMLPGHEARWKRRSENGDAFWQVLVDQFDALAAERDDRRSPDFASHDGGRWQDLGAPLHANPRRGA